MIPQPINKFVFSNMVKHTLHPEWPQGSTLGGMYREDAIAVINRFLDKKVDPDLHYATSVRIIMLGLVFRTRERIFDFLKSPSIKLEPLRVLEIQAFFTNHTTNDVNKYDPEKNMVFTGFFMLAFPDVDLCIWAQYTAPENLTVEKAAERISFTGLKLDEEMSALARHNFDNAFEEMIDSRYSGFGALWMETYRETVFKNMSNDCPNLFASGTSITPDSGFISRHELETWLDYYRNETRECYGGSKLRWRGKRYF